MLPKHMRVLRGKEAEEFIEQDKEPLSEEEMEHLERCREIYKKNPISN